MFISILKRFLPSAMLLSISAVALAKAESPVSCQPTYTYTLKRTFQVSGRRGVATDGKHYYVSDNKVLHKYSKDGTLILKNEKPFADLEKPINYIGDIDIKAGELFAAGESFMDGRGYNIQIVIYDADTLKYKRSIHWQPESGQVEASGVTVDDDSKTIWLADWTDGRYVYQYDLTSGDYKGKIHLYPVPQQQQGIFFHDDHLYIIADDGDADQEEPDHLYRIQRDADGQAAQVILEKTFVEFKRAGEISGITMAPATNELLILSNRGAKIEQGISKGFYPGYEEEFHEIYVYQMISN